MTCRRGEGGDGGGNPAVQSCHDRAHTNAVPDTSQEQQQGGLSQDRTKRLKSGQQEERTDKVTCKQFVYYKKTELRCLHFF